MIGFEYWPRIASLLAQTDPGVNVDVGTTNGLLGGAIGAFLSTLVVGAILVAVAPGFTGGTRRMPRPLRLGRKSTTDDTNHATMAGQLPNI
ncbi:hypothetical protein [Natrinema versiforme]|uniref:Uncharacterized protein n=1 Tax=Natrinema versiforme JCM 10478 TaxID=1227496 RepID=L9YCC6_9EURY|nr:hypothetical protein [Natrinema versiforme]ELY70543.1 hypothetical protein C489_02256 [Natrinema versiforme JCM 10478]